MTVDGVVVMGSLSVGGRGCSEGGGGEVNILNIDANRNEMQMKNNTLAVLV